MIYGYARVSHKDQNLDSQLQQLSKFGCEEIVQEKITGVAKTKEKLEELFETLQSGDTIVVTRLDRLGRSTIQLLSLVEQFEEKDVHFVILDMNIDTRTYTGKFFLTIMAGFAEMERVIIKEKQRAGIEIAKRKGKYRGRVREWNDKTAGLQHAISLYQSGNYTVKEITEITRISKATFYRRLREKGLVGK